MAQARQGIAVRWKVQGPSTVIAHQRTSAKDTAESEHGAYFAVCTCRQVHACPRHKVKARNLRVSSIAIGMWKPEKLDNSVM